MWIVPFLHSEPLSLFVVSLAPVNEFHHWLVIRRFSCMFDFSSHIRMLEFVLCLGRDGAQDPGFCLIRSKLQDIFIYHDYMNDSFDWMDETIPESIC